jgi:hypothetical protein
VIYAQKYDYMFGIKINVVSMNRGLESLRDESEQLMIATVSGMIRT